jgi:hypothetical protein
MFGTPAARRLLLLTAVSATAAAIIPAVAANASPGVPSACPSCGHNLILNPGAEKGKGADADVVVKVPDWKQKGGFTAALYTWPGGDLTPKSPGPKLRGKNYFYGGPDAARSTGTQVAKIAAAGISGGKARYDLSGWLGGWETQGDNARLIITFETGSGKAISSAQIGPVTEKQRKGNSELLFRSRTGAVPAGTRSVKIELIMIREEGSDNDGLADNLSLEFTQ